MKVKLSPDSLNFLRDWVSQFKPYEVSDDSLVDLERANRATTSAVWAIGFESGRIAEALQRQRR
jgi:hypothetical protein